MSEIPSPVPAGSGDRAAAEHDYRRARECLAANDLAGAARWLEQAAVKEHPAALSELAILHLHGFDREVDPAMAVQLLLRAEASGGTPETSWLLAQIALGGIALPCDSQRIDAWIADSARRGHPIALRVAGIVFGRQPDSGSQRAASICLKRATEARDPIAAALFADRLHAGRGVTRDTARALDLANQLRALGVPVELPAADDESDAFASYSDFEPPWDALHALDAELPVAQLHCVEPEIATFDGLLCDEECRYLIYSGARHVERSQVVHPGSGQQVEYNIRTSQDMAFVPTLDDAGIRILQLRMARAAGFELGNCEPLALLRYGRGDEYRPHRDYFPPSATQLAQSGGQRHSTVCTYLNDVELGGQTVFPDMHVTIQPKRGRAVMFRNLHADGRADPRSLHAGLPVKAGEKWLASCWIRMRQQRLQ